MDDFASRDNVDIAGEKYEDIDPAIFDDPILMLRWLDGKSQRDGGLPIQPLLMERTFKSEMDTLIVADNHDQNINQHQRSDYLAIMDDIAAADEADIVAGFAQWLSDNTSSDIRSECNQAYEIIENCAYKYKLLDKNLLQTTDLTVIRRIQSMLMQKREFRNMDATKRYYCGLALRYYIQYLSERKA